MVLDRISYSDSRHDTVIEINGPSTIDVINNYKLRWNNHNIFNKSEAMETCKPFTDDIADFVYIKDAENENKDNQQPLQEEKENDNGGGTVDAQVCATIYPNIYPGYESGESSIHYQYYQAFYKAKNSIYIESQHPGDYHLLK